MPDLALAQRHMYIFVTKLEIFNGILIHCIQSIGQMKSPKRRFFSSVYITLRKLWRIMKTWNNYENPCSCFFFGNLAVIIPQKNPKYTSVVDQLGHGFCMSQMSRFWHAQIPCRDWCRNIGMWDVSAWNTYSFFISQFQ